MHIGLLSHFTEGMTYQDNILSDMHCQDGNDVMYVSDNYVYQNGRLIEKVEEDITLSNSLRLIRVKYDRVLNTFITNKIQKVKSLKKIICNFEPDRILYHGVCGRELVTVADYKKRNPQIKLYVDCHADFHNTAKNIVSKLAYKYIHGFFFKQALPYIDKVLYVTKESKEYLINMYKLDESIMEWFPLGGIVLDDKTYQRKRKRRRTELELKDSDILFLHSGKMDKKKKTLEILKAFAKVEDNRFKLIIIGEFLDSMWEEVKPYLCLDERILFLGWKTGDELIEYLCAADVYLQPGSQSATMQNAICCRCSVVLFPYSGYLDFVKGNGFFARDRYDMVRILTKIHKEPTIIELMKEKSEQIARDILDYRKIAARIYY